MAVLDKAAHRAPDGTWTFQCPGIDGSPCGDLGTGQPFVSSGWPTKAIAQARGRQHLDEHKHLGHAASLDDFRAEHGLTAHANGIHAVQIEGLS
jgi:hypothetical protein